MNKRNILTVPDVEQAMNEGRLIPVFHPLINVSSGALYGVEVLARIVDPKERILTPDRFITCVEDSGLIVPFTLTLMRETIPVMTALSALRPATSENVIVSFNVPAAILQYPELLMACRYFIQNTPENTRLALELTERCRLSFTDAECRTASALKSAGVLLWLDDFGTGYSDFLALKSGLFDAIKIPREFISTQGRCAVTDVLRQSITATGKHLNIPVIAEGVENAAQTETLRQEGVDFLQGYFFSHPLSAEELLIYSGKDDTNRLEPPPVFY